LADLQQRLGWTPHEAQRAVALLLKLNVLALAPEGLGNPLASMGP
jgi:hypothetical protein